MSNSISLASLGHLLGIDPTTPLTTADMCARLSITFLPAENNSSRLQCFTSALLNACNVLGIRILSEQEACRSDGTFKPGIVVMAPGEFSDELLAINRVSTLYNNIIVGIHDEHPPLTAASSPQNKLDRIVGKLAWDMVHLSIYVTQESWTICTMNGGVVSIGGTCPLPSDVRKTLVPKLSAQVVPPKTSDLDHKPGAFKAGLTDMQEIVKDFATCGKRWSSNHYLLTHTSRETLQYRSPLYRKIVARYLDQRSGMSYGFFARQQPASAPPALLLKESGCMASESELKSTPLLSLENKHYVPVLVMNEWFLVEPVPVTVITTRSGCRKTNLNPDIDLVALRLDKGTITLMTPQGLPNTTISRPSFDTLTILSHALGNVFISSILQKIRPSSLFPELLAKKGASMTHWHGYPGKSVIPDGYFSHGRNNPPVSCSTPQSAAYSLQGKIEALEQSLRKNRDYQGDIHIEPNHGTNIVGLYSLSETASFINGL
ncbi:hypothetical protein [Prosthecochloris sp.]|uniref:hypothetical protein n=1 Tax=Prosthecochloris sp. TaxID=290513 RepID=UPI0025D0F206|nr:hypothetical protein [Prosthecochloris sp.]